MRVTVQVTKQHIESGVDHSPWRCPIAHAVAEVKQLENYGVGVDCLFMPAHIKVAGAKRKLDLPLVARKFIKKFDANKPVKPFKFTITGI